MCVKKKIKKRGAQSAPRKNYLTRSSGLDDGLDVCHDLNNVALLQIEAELNVVAFTTIVVDVGIRCTAVSEQSIVTESTNCRVSCG